MSTFAQVQARRLSPFQRSGASAMRRGGRMYLWIWDIDEVERLLGQSAPPKARLQAEAIYVTWPGGSATTRRYSQAEERIDMLNGEWVGAEVVNLCYLDLSALTQRPAGYDWLAGRLDDAHGGTANDQARAIFNRASSFAAIAALCFLGFEAGSLSGTRVAIERLDARLTEHTTSRQQLSLLSATAREDEEWAKAYLEAAAQLDVPGALETLRPVMESFGVVIRELDAGGEQIKITFATAGGEMRLPDLLGALRRVPEVKQASLQQQKDLAEATFILTMPALVKQRLFDGQEPSTNGAPR